MLISFILTLENIILELQSLFLFHFLKKFIH